MTAQEADEALHRKLRDFARAYPEDVFPPTTAEERLTLSPGLLSRISADMGRHFAKFATEAADAFDEKCREVERLRAALEPLDEAARYFPDICDDETSVPIALKRLRRVSALLAKDQPK